MNVLNIEIKTRIDDPERIEKYLIDKNAEFKGLDNQQDTYFNSNSGRLKLRSGNIENTLIQYDRKETKALKTSKVILQSLDTDHNGIRTILKEQLGIRHIVNKSRKIYFIDNVKFHIDEVNGLGNFLEIEAISFDGKYDKKYLSEQCNFYIKDMKLDTSRFIDKSYVDLIEEQNHF